MSTDPSHDDPLVPVTIAIRRSTLDWLEELRIQLGLLSRDAVLNRLLEELVTAEKE